MKYYLIVGEASGDCHASRLMQALREADAGAEFRFYGGDLMAEAGGSLVRHYRTLAYMGFLPVLAHLPSIAKGFVECYRDIWRWKPDVVIPVDYSGFNLPMLWLLHRRTGIPTYYYISPKFWAWQRWRAGIVRRHASAMFAILPFEEDFYKSIGFRAQFVGNPTVSEVDAFQASYTESLSDFAARHELPSRPIIALLPGSRRQEIRGNLPAMLAATADLRQRYAVVVARVGSVEPQLYDILNGEQDVFAVESDTYALLHHATAAVVVSGTATLETAVFGVPQVVCYHTGMPRLTRWAFRHFMSVRFISLVNLIAGSEVVPELFADGFSAENISRHLRTVMPDGLRRAAMMQGYKRLRDILGSGDSAKRAATAMLRHYHNATNNPPLPSR